MGSLKETPPVGGLQSVSRLRIGMVTLSFSPGHVTPFPGVNRYSVSLAEALTSIGAEVRVITPLVGDTTRSEVWQGIEIARIEDSKTVFGRLGVVAELNFRSFELNLIRHIDLINDCDVLHTDIPMPRIGMSWRRAPLIAVVHHVYRIWTGMDLLTVPFGVMYQRRTLEAAEAVVTPSSSAAEDTMKLYRVPKRKVRIIHHGVDTALFQPRGSMKGVPLTDGPRLAY